MRNIVVLAIALIGIIEAKTVGQVLNSNPGFEDGNWTNYFRPSSQNSTDALIEVSSSPTRNGSKSLHLRHQLKGTAPTNRCEIIPNANLGGSSRGYVRWHQEIWIGFSVYLDDWSSSLGPWNSIMQVHSIPYNNDWSTTAGPNAWQIYGNNGTFGWTTVSQPHIFIHTKPISDPYNSSPPDALSFGTPLWWTPISNVNDKWVDIVANFVISPDSDGKMRWWINGELVVDFTGPNVYYYDTGGRPAVQQSIVQIGSYKSHTNTNVVNMYFDEIRFGNGSASYQDVAPGGGSPINNLPVLNPIGNQTLLEGTSKSVNLTASDIDGDNLTFSTIQNIDFVSLVDNGGGNAVLNINPQSGDAGTYQLTIKVTDSKNGSDSKTINIVVDQAVQGNSRPVLSSIGNQDLAEEDVLNVTLNASDPDGDDLVFSFSPNIDFVSITNNNNGTAVLKIEPLLGDAGSYELIVKVTDPSGSWDSKTIIINVEESRQGNSKPVLSPIGNKSVPVGNQINVALSASDADGDALSFTYSPNLSFIKLTDNHNGTGSLTFNPLPEDYGSYNIVVTVKDIHNNFDIKSFTLTVVRQENGNSIPFIEPVLDQVVIEGESKEIKLMATDADRDPLSYHLETKLSFVSLLAKGDGTAVLTVSPKIGDAGKYEISIKVTDSYNGTAIESFNLIVNDMNWINSNFINSGGKSVTFGSMLAKQDEYYVGGKAAMRSADFHIEGTEGEEIYQSMRYGDFSYEIPVPHNGTYLVRLHFAEINFNDEDIGKRIFNVDVENGQQMMINYDIVADVGARKATVKSFSGIIVKDGTLSIDLKTVARNAVISGIEYISESNQVTQLDQEKLQSEIAVYPNPSDGFFTIEIKNNSSEVQNQPIKIFDIAGKVIYQSDFSGIRKFIDIRGKHNGLYLLQIGSSSPEKLFIQ